MKNSRKAILFFLASWIIIKVVFLSMNDTATGIYAGVFVNLFAMIVLPFVALREDYIGLPKRRNFLQDLKSAIQPSAIYVVTIAIGIFVYFKYADPSYTAERYQETVEMLEDSANTEEKYAEIQKENPALNNLSREEYINSQKESMELIYSVQLYSIGSLIALLFGAIIYALLVTVLFRRLWLKQRIQ